MDGWMDGWLGGREDGCMHACMMDGQIDGRVDGLVYEWKHGQINKQIGDRERQRDYRQKDKSQGGVSACEAFATKPNDDLSLIPESTQ